MSAVISSASISSTAVAELRNELLDWRFKGLPASAFGKTVEEFLAEQPNLFTGGFVGPLVVIDAQALAHNLSTMADWCATRGLALAPHGKTTMAPQLFARQLDHGAWGMTCANISQLRVYRAFRVSRITVANEFLDPAGLHWLAEELDADPDFEFSCWVDSVAGVQQMDAALHERPPGRPVDVLVELGGQDGRAGVRTEAEALAVAEAVRVAEHLRLVGVGGYEGAVAHGGSAEAMSVVDDYMARLRAITLAFHERRYFAGLDRVIVTAGGSAYFDRVAEGLRAPWPEDLPVLALLRSGAYITHDDGYYRAISPLRTQGEQALRPALHAWAQVSSLPQPDLAILTMGKRDASFDEGLPEPQQLRTADGNIRDLAGHSVHKLSDQHTFLTLPPGSPVAVGDWVRLGLSHPCTVFDKWGLIPVVDGSTVVDLIRTFF